MRRQDWTDHVSPATQLAEAGHPEADAGTVDKFQGQEAPVGVYSMVSPSAGTRPGA